MKPYMDEMATHGRYGDSMLVHMNPAEVQGIASLAPQGQLTINPVTGQPEAFLPFLAPLLGSMAGSALLPALPSALAGAIGSGVATAAVTGDIKRGLVSGLIGAGTGALFEGAAGAADATSGLQDIATNIGAAGDATVADVLSQAGTEQALASEALKEASIGGGALPLSQVAQANQLTAQVGDISAGLGDRLGDLSGTQISELSPAMEGARSFGSGMMGAKAILPTAMGYGQLAQMDYEDQMKAAGMQNLEAEQAQRDEAVGNLQRGYAMAQPNVATGPSEYRKYLSNYTPPYEYAAQGGIVSLMGGGPVKKYQAGGEFDPKVYAQSLPAGVREIYLKSNTDGYDSLTEKEAATLSNYYSSAGAGFMGGKGGAINIPQTGTQGGADTASQDPAPPALPTSGYMRDPNTGAIVYLAGTRPGAGEGLSRQGGSPYIGSGKFGTGGMGNLLGSNPGYGGIDPISIQANLRGQYAVTPPSGYALGFEPEFSSFQNDPFNVQVPYRGYYPKAFGPMQSGPYFHSSINMPNYLNQIGDYYRTLGDYSVTPEVPLGGVTQPVVQPTVTTPVTTPTYTEPPATPTPVADATPKGGIDDIVVGNYEGGEKPTPQTLTGDDLYETYIDQRQTERPIYHYNNKGELIKGVPVVGKMKPGRYYHVNLAHEDAEASFASKKQAMDYIRNYYGQTDANDEQAKAFEDAAKAKEEARAALEAERLAGRRPNEADAKRSGRTIPEHIRRAAERQAQQTSRPTGKGLSVTGASGKTTYFQEGGLVSLAEGRRVPKDTNDFVFYNKEATLEYPYLGEADMFGREIDMQRTSLSDMTNIGELLEILRANAKAKERAKERAENMLVGFTDSEDLLNTRYMPELERQSDLLRQRLRFLKENDPVYYAGELESDSLDAYRDDKYIPQSLLEAIDEEELERFKEFYRRSSFEGGDDTGLERVEYTTYSMPDSEIRSKWKDRIQKEMQEGGDVTLETSLGDMSTPAGGIANVETQFVKQQPAMPQIAPEETMIVAQAILGRIEQPDAIIDMFIQKYGVENFLMLRQQVLASVAGVEPQTEGMIKGQGGGMDDQVMGMIGDQQPVAVSPGEYIVPADVVSGLGDGSSDAGAKELDQMLDDVRKARQGGRMGQPPAIDAQRMMP